MPDSTVATARSKFAESPVLLAAVAMAALAPEALGALEWGTGVVAEVSHCEKEGPLGVAVVLEVGIKLANKESRAHKTNGSIYGVNPF